MFSPSCASPRRRAPAGVLSSLALALAGIASNAAAFDAPLAADTQFSTTQPSSVFGALPNLNVGGGSTALLRFDLSTLPGDVTSSRLAKATLIVWINRIGKPGQLELVAATSPWTEAAASGANAPGTAAAGSGTIVPVATAGQFVSVDVTAQVRGWIDAPASNYGVALRPSPDSADTVAVLDSKENTLTGHQPRLDLTFAGEGVPGAIGATGTPGQPGARGATGVGGPGGAAGLIGATGTVGPAGNPGAAGGVGPGGAAGVAGATGPDGVAGTQGARGPAGPAGTPGATGRTGATGPAGPVGPTGATGPAGFDGATRVLLDKVESSIPTVPFGPTVTFKTIYSTACPANSYVISGGCGHRDKNTAAGDIEVYQSGPSPDDPLHTWMCRAANASHSDGRAIVVWRICSSAAQVSQ